MHGESKQSKSVWMAFAAPEFSTLKENVTADVCIDES